MKSIYNLKINDYRKLVETDPEVQNVILQVLMTGFNQKNNESGLNLKTACYAVVFVLNGTNGFNGRLKEIIEESVARHELDPTFLKGNYAQVAEKYWNAKTLNEEFYNILFGDPVTNEGRKGNQAIHTGKATSKLMKKYIEQDILDYQIGDVLLQMNKRLDDSNLISNEKRNHIERELSYAKRILKMYGYAEDEMKRSNVEFDQEIEIRKQYGGSEKQALILARRGQGKFRAEVMKINDKCPFTMISNDELLVASHIKPWKDSNELEKVDPNNGFMFSPTYDKLFDKGLISFTDEGCLLVSPELDRQSCELLGLTKGKKIKELKITDQCIRFLAYHRKLIFRKGKQDDNTER